MKLICAIVFAAAIAVITTNMPVKTDGDRIETRPRVIVVSDADCAPCERLKLAWKAAAKPGDRGHNWRRWIVANFQVAFVDLGDMPPKIKSAVTAVPAVFIHPPGGGRAGPLTLSIDKQETAVATFGSLLERETRRNARE